MRVAPDITSLYNVVMAPRPAAAAATEVVAATLALLDEHGADGVTLRGVAERLGVSTQVVYSRFGGRSGLLDAVTVAVFADVTALVEGVPDADRPADELVAVGLAIRRYALTHPHRMALLAAPVGDPAALELAKAEAGLSMERLVAQIARALPGVDQAELVRTVEVLWAGLLGLLELERVGHLDADGAEERIAVLVTALSASTAPDDHEGAPS